MAERTSTINTEVGRVTADYSFPESTGVTRNYECDTLPPSYEYAMPIRRKQITKQAQSDEDSGPGTDPGTDPGSEDEDTENTTYPMNNLPSCYCGVISRSDSERILKTQPVGTYLLRVSETRDGYTVSLRTTDRCKHFAVEENLENGKFVVLGEKPKFLNFNDLIRFYKVHPISPHGDLLQTPLKKHVLLEYFQNTPPSRVILKNGD